MVASPSTAAVPWPRRLRFLLEALAVRGIGTLVSYLPRRAMLAMGEGLGELAYHLAWSWRRVALDNLRNVFGNSKSPREIERIARQSFRNIGGSFLELFWIRRLDLSEVPKFVDIDEDSFQAVKEAHERGRGVIFIPTHFGRWEIMNLAYNQTGHHVTFIGKPLHNPYLDTYLKSIRCRTGNRVLYMGRAVREMYSILREGGAVAILIDQKQPVRRGGVLVDFLGRPAATTTGIARLAIRHGSTLLPVYCLPLPKGRCRAVFGPPIDYEITGDRDEDVRRITRQCVEATEGVIREHPQYWLWAHKRWKIDEGPARVESAPSAGEPRTTV